MAEGGDDSTDESQKTEEPTARRLEEARKRGQVVYSKEVSNWAMLFTATLIIVSAGSYIMQGLSETFVVFLARPHMISTDGGGLAETLRSVILDTASYILLPLFVLAFAGIISGFVQTGPIFSAETMKPDISKLSPMKGFARLFSGKSIAEFIKGIAKLLIVSAAGFMALLPYFDTIDHFYRPGCRLGFAGHARYVPLPDDRRPDRPSLSSP
jgi:flagellar biosynthetic protein FlhB